uniref:Uncharacterized protein n=1 Tax=Arundo donax TaxID=35708 RepID=A0A0A9ARP7_ARUDO
MATLMLSCMYIAFCRERYDLYLLATPVCYNFLYCRSLLT